MNEEQLIQFLFDLCTESEKVQFQKHLESSPEDRARLEQLRARFGQLDLIKEEVSASETLIADTLRNVRLAAPPKGATSHRFLWLCGATAAAALAIALVVPAPVHDLRVVKQSAATHERDGYEVTLAQAPEPLDEIAPLAESDASAGLDIPAAAAPPMEEPMIAMVDDVRKELPSAAAHAQVDESLLAKYALSDRAAAPAFRQDQNYAISATPGRTTRSLVGAQKTARSSDEDTVVDLDRGMIDGSWSAGPNGSALFNAVISNGMAQVAISNSSESFGLEVRWNGKSVVRLSTGGHTNFVINLQIGE